ncbi:hypothetical protein ACW582_14960 [Pseudomonas chlororaphis]
MKCPLEHGNRRFRDWPAPGCAGIGKRFKVNEVIIEGNFGDGMYLKLFSPVMTRTHRCAVTEVKSKGQKELRICDVLEPVLGCHKLVVMEDVIERDYETALNIDATTDVKLQRLLPAHTHYKGAGFSGPR